MCKLYCKPCATEFDGTPCAVKAARTVWSRGKVGDYIKDLPMAIRLQVSGHETIDGWRRCRFGRHHPHPPAERAVRLNPVGGVCRPYIAVTSFLAADRGTIIIRKHTAPNINLLSKGSASYGISDPSYFRSEPAQKPYQPFQLRR